MESLDDADRCGNLRHGNGAAQLHVMAASFFGVYLVSKEWGLATTEASCLLLEIAQPEKIAATLISFAFTLTLYVLSKRETHGEDPFVAFAGLVNGALWTAAFVLITYDYDRKLGKRKAKQAFRRSMAMPFWINPGLPANRRTEVAFSAVDCVARKSEPGSQ